MSLCLVSTTSHRAVAGLSAYVRGLAAAAIAGGCAITSVARFETDGRRGLDPLAREAPRRFTDPLGNLSIIAPERRSRPALYTVRPLIHQPRAQGFAIRAFDLAYRRALSAAMPSDAAVVHFSGCGWELLGFPALALARERGVPFSVLPGMHPGEWGDSAVDGRLYRSADLVFALSRHEHERLLDLGVDPSRIVTTPLAPALHGRGDGQRFRERHALGDRPVVLFTGRKERYKGYHALVEAMVQVHESVPGAVLVAAGAPGAEPPEPTPLLVDLGLCDEATKEDALAACDVFCMPSDGESFGIVYTEAWVYGKPVVGGPAPAARELITTAGGGLALESRRPELLATALTALLTDPAERRRLGEAGRESQRRRYSWDAVWRVHRDAWEHLTGPRSGAASPAAPAAA